MPDDQQSPWEKYSAPADQGPWAKYAAPTPQAAAPDQPAPTPLQRFSEVTLGTQHPVDDTMAALGQWRAHPLQSALTTAKQTAMVIPNMLMHPLDSIKGMTGGNQFSEDVGQGHYGNAAADVLGGITNTAPMLLGGEPLGDAAAGALSKIPDAGGIRSSIGERMYSPTGKLKPGVNVASKVLGGAAGTATGIPYGGLGGLLMGPEIAKTLFPDPTPPTLMDQARLGVAKTLARRQVMGEMAPPPTESALGRVGGESASGNPDDLISRMRKVVVPGEEPSPEDLKRAGDFTQAPLSKLQTLARFGDKLAQNELNRRLKQ